MIRLFTALLLIAFAGSAWSASNCITSGNTSSYTYFVAVDSTDKVTRETGLSSFTVYRSRNGGTATAFTTPTVNETSSSNMPGVYELLLDEDMTVSGNAVEHMALHITHAGMEPVTKEICIAPAASISDADLGIVASGTAQAGTSSTIQLASATSFADDALIGATIMLVSGTGAGQSRVVTDWVSSTDTATVAPNWTTNPSSDTIYRVYGTAPVEGAGGATAEEVWAYSDRTITGGTVTTNSDKTGYSLSSSQTFSNTGTWTGNITGNVGGTVNGLTSTAQGHVQTAAAAALTAYDPPTNAEMTARTLAAADYATASALQTVDSVVDDIKIVTDKLDTVLEADESDWKFTAASLAETPVGEGGGLDAAGVRNAIGLATANLDVQLGAIDSVADAIKVTTDKIDDTLEDNGGTYRFTEPALAQAPTGEGGGGGTDWDADERTAIRSILGIPASGTTPADPSAGILDTIRDAVAAQNDVSTSDVQSAAAAALVAYDPPTRAEATSDTDSVLNAISGLNDIDVSALRDLVIEDQGGGVSLGCALSVILAYAAGDLTTAGNAPTYSDPSGSETRISGTISSAGNRSITITCPSY